MTSARRRVQKQPRPQFIHSLLSTHVQFLKVPARSYVSTLLCQIDFFGRKCRPFPPDTSEDSEPRESTYIVPQLSWTVQGSTGQIKLELIDSSIQHIRMTVRSECQISSFTLSSLTTAEVATIAS